MLFTIGHSNHPIETFLSLLGRHGIECLADVRSKPYSRFNPQFRKQPLANALAERGIDYRFLGDGLGGKRDEPEARDETGRVSYERVMQLDGFRAALDALLELASARRTAMMCAEAEPLDCHRFVLVCRALRTHGAGIGHIRRDGALEWQDAAEDRLLRRMKIGPDLLAGDDREALIQRAYRLRAERMTGSQ